MTITWIGQGGFIFDSGTQRLVVDPYLSNCLEQWGNCTRLCPPPLTVQQLNPDIVLCTHEHADHLDPVTIPQIAAQYPACRFAGPPSVIRRLGKLGLDQQRVLPLSSGQSLAAGDLSITATPAYHNAPDAIGLIVRQNGHAIYCSGDTEFHPLLAAQVAKLSPTPLDVMLICINGRMGNMNSQQAVQVALELRPRMAIPMHYGLFAQNTADPEPFVRGCQAGGVSAMTLVVGQCTSMAWLKARAASPAA